MGRSQTGRPRVSSRVSKVRGIVFNAETRRKRRKCGENNLCFSCFRNLRVSAVKREPAEFHLESPTSEAYHSPQGRSERRGNAEKTTLAFLRVISAFSVSPRCKEEALISPSRPARAPSSGGRSG